MAASILSWRLSNALGSLRSIALQGIDNFPRVLTTPQLSQIQTSRGRRRTCKKRSWHVKRTVDTNLLMEPLTKESSTFLHEMVVEKYKDRMANSPLKTVPTERNAYTFNTKRTGVLAIKLGVIPQWTKDGKRFKCTLLQVLDNHVIRYVDPEKYKTSDGFKKKKWVNPRFGMMVVGALSSDPFSFSKAYNNLFAEAGIPPKRKLTRFLVTPDAAIEPGTPLKATHFNIGDYVDVQAKTVGHGFQGVVKRWGFKGGPASHGNTKWHRRPGSIGGGGDKAAVWKGKKMPGHMGMDWNTLLSLKIWRIDTKYNVLYVMGGNVPGPNRAYVRVYDSQLPNRKQHRITHQPPMPTFYPDDVDGQLPEEIFDENLFQFTQPTITFDDKDK